ncbi:MAG TPA: hypothetical protein VE967_11050 [Gemmatimonadaceae bacterium]|nr:hypothetical protein [Gemmatimonadaceae bacterium]
MLSRVVLLGAALFTFAACDENSANAGTGIYDKASGSIKASVNGTTVNATKNVHGILTGNDAANSAVRRLLIQAENSDGTVIYLHVESAFGPGTYPLGGSPATPSYGAVSQGGTTHLWISNALGGTGSVTIDEISDSHAKGSFTFVAVPQPGSPVTGSMTVTSGTFDISPN